MTEIAACVTRGTSGRNSTHTACRKTAHRIISA